MKRFTIKKFNSIDLRDYVEFLDYLKAQPTKEKAIDILTNAYAFGYAANDVLDYHLYGGKLSKKVTEQITYIYMDLMGLMGFNPEEIEWFCDDNNEIRNYMLKAVLDFDETNHMILAKEKATKAMNKYYA